MAESKDLRGAILGMGNPLLDISANVEPAVLDKYGLKLNNAILAEEKHLPLYGELVAAGGVQYVAGGATQNSIRVAQWMLQDAAPGATSYIGCVGTDAYADQLRKSAEADGVRVHYQVDPEHPTGTCACLIHKHERSLVANLSAANHYKESHLDTPESREIVERARIFYSAGFFLTVSPDSMVRVAKHAHEHGKTYVMNLAAPFLPAFFSEPMMRVMPYVDILIGNESEAVAFAEKQGWPERELDQIALKMAELPKANTARPRLVIVTHGAQPTVVAENGKTTTYPVPPVPEAEMVDVNGAGDAFVGGFLSQILLGAPVARAVEAGHYAAGVIVRVSGCTLSGKPSFH